jgi:hypothetical protein
VAEDKHVGSSLALGLFLGMVFTELWSRWQLRGWSDAIERGDFDQAQAHLRRYYLGTFPHWFRKPPPEGEKEPGG